MNLSDFGFVSRIYLKKTQASLFDFPMQYDKPHNPIVEKMIAFLQVQRRFEQLDREFEESDKV